MKDKREALELPGSPMGRVCGEELWAARWESWFYSALP